MDDNENNKNNENSSTNSDSILISIKKLLGIGAEYNVFDPDIIIHINTAFSTLSDLGVGPSEGFSINDDKATWSSYIQNDKIFESVKTYIYLRVKILFDPPLNSSVLETIKENIKELEWRLNVNAESKELDE